MPTSWYNLTFKALKVLKVVKPFNIFILVDICAGVSCPNYGKCEQTATGFKCGCNKVCNEPYSAICGDDGRTYNNKCQMKIQSCSLKKSIQVKHVGKCGKCCYNICVGCSTLF